eukprot:354921-Chlamydomonas_euryale.AAC.15
MRDGRGGAAEWLRHWRRRPCHAVNEAACMGPVCAQSTPPPPPLALAQRGLSSACRQLRRRPPAPRPRREPVACRRAPRKPARRANVGGASEMARSLPGRAKHTHCLHLSSKSSSLRLVSRYSSSMRWNVSWLTCAAAAAAPQGERKPFPPVTAAKRQLERARPVSHARSLAPARPAVCLSGRSMGACRCPLLFSRCLPACPLPGAARPTPSRPAHVAPKAAPPPVSNPQRPFGPRIAPKEHAVVRLIARARSHALVPCRWEPSQT